MNRVFIAILMAFFITSCGGDKQEQAPAESASKQDKPIQMIPNEPETALDNLVGASISPYFDKEGSVTEKEVALGETFSIYVVGKYNKNYEMSAAEWCLILPEGLEVMHEVKAKTTVLTVGHYEEDFMMTFKCALGPQILLREYVCRLNEGAGGILKTGLGKHNNFIGYTMCDQTVTAVKAKTGQASLKVKSQ